MSQPKSKLVRFTLPDEMYIDLIGLLDTRIRSERARASAYRSHADRSNEMIAQGNMARLFTLRNTIVESCRIEVDDV
jgi:hypothetical protein